MNKLEQMQEYREKHKAKYPWMKHYHSSSTRAKRKGWVHTMSKEDFKELWERDNAHQLERPSIDRIDSTKGYEKENCRFIELTENSRLGNAGKKLSKKTKAKVSKAQKGNLNGLKYFITYKGKTQSLLDWAKEIGISSNILRQRIVRYKLPPEIAFTPKLLKRGTASLSYKKEKYGEQIKGYPYEIAGEGDRKV